MKKYTLIYLCTLHLMRPIEAETEKDAWDKAWELEDAGELGLSEIAAMPGSILSDELFDRELVWLREEEE